MYVHLGTKFGAIALIVIVAVTLLVIYLGVTSSGPKGKSAHKPQPPAAAPLLVDNYAVNKAKAEMLVAFFIKQMGRRPRGLRRADLSMIQDEYARARVAYWDFVQPVINFNTAQPCWQYRVTDSRYTDPHMDVIITPAGDWAVMGRSTQSIIKDGDLRDVGSVPWAGQSNDSHIPSETVHILDSAIRLMLKQWVPNALTAYRNLHIEWDAHGAASAQKAAEQQAAIKKIEDERRAEAARIAEIHQAKAQRQMIDEKIVQPFLQAMRQTGNPGASWWNMRWSDGGNRKHRDFGRFYGSEFYFDVYINGDWLFGETSGTSGTRTKVTRDAWRITPHFHEGEALSLNDWQVKRFQNHLVALLRKYGVTLPPD